MFLPLVIACVIGPLTSNGLNLPDNFFMSSLKVHNDMTVEQLAFHFGKFKPNDVDDEDYQIISVKKSGNITKRSGSSPDGHTIHLEAFGRNLVIPLKRNFNLLSPHAVLVDTSYDNVTGKVVQKRMSVIEDDDEYPIYSCHYLHNSNIMGAALSNCGNGDEYRGFVTDIEHVYELYPADLKIKEKLPKPDKRDGSSNQKYHIITRRKMSDLSLQLVDKDLKKVEQKILSEQPKRKRSGKSNLVIETAVFLDKAAYDVYFKFYDGDKQKIRNMILAFVNGMQAIYHFPKLRKTIDFTIVRINIMETNPFNTGGAERTQLLSNFCQYQGQQNPGQDNNPEHWDIGLLLSGLDFWANEGGQVSSITMGLATVTGICTNEYGCVIGEIGVRNQEGRPYPSTGFTSVYVMAHEIGHNLGMSHDHTAGCDKDGYVMSYSRGTKGETLWSSCSADVLDKLDLPCLEENSSPPKPENDHSKYKNLPGLYWSAVEQCQFLLQDKRAKVNHDPSNMGDMCDRLLCRLDESGANGYFAAGPALEGTACRNASGQNNDYFCIQGGCIQRTDIRDLIISATAPTPKPPSQASGTATTALTSVAPAQPQWGPWKYESCYTGCLLNSRGALTRRRECIIPKPVASATQCQGPTTEVQLCDISLECDVMTANDFATAECKNYQAKSPRLGLSLTGNGKQPAHNPNRVEQACTVFCETSKTGEWYSPQLELSQVKNVQIYFPDGTWCNNDSKGDYFCRKHECLPVNSRAGRSDKSPDIKFMHNARAEGGELDIPDPLKEYFTLDEKDKPKNSDPSVFTQHTDQNDELEQSDDTISIDQLAKLASS